MSVSVCDEHHTHVYTWCGPSLDTDIDLSDSDDVDDDDDEHVDDESHVVSVQC